MESLSVVLVAPKENGSSQLSEKDDPVDVEEKLPVDDVSGECNSVDQSMPDLQSLEDENVDDKPEDSEAKNDEPCSLDEFASDEVIAESIVVASVNGDQVTLVHDEVSADGGAASTESEEICVANSEKLEEPDEVDEGSTKPDSPAEEEPAVESESTPEEPTEGTVEGPSTQLEEQSDVEVEKSGRKKNQKKDGGSSRSDECGGKDSTKSRFAIQADLNINSRPKRSVPRRSVFEMLQGEIRSTGHSKKLSTDTGSESDPEPGPSRRANSRKSRVSTTDRSEGVYKDRRGGEESSQDGRRGQQMKRRNQERDEETLRKESQRPYKKKSIQSSCGKGSSAEEQTDAFMSDDFDLVEAVVGVEGHNDQEFDLAASLEDEDDNLTLASFRKANLQHSPDYEPSDNQVIPCEDLAADAGADTESNFEDLEYNSRWHSYATPSRLESPLNVQETSQMAKEQDGNQSRPTSHSKILSATSVKKSDRGRDSSPRQFEDEGNERSGTPWYLAGSARNETFLNDPKALQNRIDELLKANAELRTRLKEVETKSSTKKFNIDFHSRKFSKAREPVFGSPVDRKSAISSGKTGVGVIGDKGSSSLERDLKGKELALHRREEKLRALDSELDERTALLKAGEGKLLRSERRLKELEKTLEYRERALKRMESNPDRNDLAGDVPDNPEEPTGQTSDSTVEIDGTKLERKEQELERLRRFLSEERERLLPKQQRLTKWEAALRKKEEELRLKEHRVMSTGVSRKRRISKSDEDTDSDEVSKPVKTSVTKSAAPVHRRTLTMAKRKEVRSYKTFKVTSKVKPSSINKIKTVACKNVHTKMNVLVGKKRPTDGTPLKEYKLRKRC